MSSADIPAPTPEPIIIPQDLAREISKSRPNGWFDEHEATDQTVPEEDVQPENQPPTNPEATEDETDAFADIPSGKLEEYPDWPVVAYPSFEHRQKPSEEFVYQMSGFQELDRKIAGLTHSTLFGKNINSTIAHHNIEAQKYIDELTGAAPDDNERALVMFKALPRYDENGHLYWLRYDGSSVTWPEQVKMMRRVNRSNPALAQAIFSYEINKREEEEQEGAYQDILDTALLPVELGGLGWDKHMIMEVFIGLQFKWKPMYLAMKHTAIDSNDVDGNPYYIRNPDGKSFVLDKNGNKVPGLRLGKLNTFGYVRELSSKFPVHQMGFRPSDTARLYRVCQELRSILYENYIEKGQEGVDSPEFREAAYFFCVMRRVMEQSKLANLQDEEDPEKAMMPPIDPQIVDGLLRRGTTPPAYPAKIGGPAIANDHWQDIDSLIQKIYRTTTAKDESGKQKYPTLPRIWVLRKREFSRRNDEEYWDAVETSDEMLHEQSQRHGGDEIATMRNNPDVKAAIGRVATLARREGYGKPAKEFISNDGH